MAATLTDSNELTYVSFPIEKTETTPDGDLLVYGKATDGSVDSDEQIVDPDFSSKAIQEWLASGANVRVQHNSQRDPAGVGIECNIGPEGDTWVKSLVVEPIAKKLVQIKALRAYSVGIARPKIIRDAVARGGRIVDGEIVEISLVDRPANKNCGIQLVKAANDGHAEWVGKMFGNSDLLTKAENDVVTVDLPKDASVSFKPSDLAKLMAYKQQLTEAEIAKREFRPEVGGGVDVDKLPESDFAGRDRSFPIVTPGDVSDAASSIGRAGPKNYSTEKLKENIIRIARRKGDAFVSELPEKWKKEKSAEDVEVEKGKKGKKGKGKNPFPGAAPAFDHQPGDKDNTEPVKKGDVEGSSDTAEGGDTADVSEMSEAKPDVTKKPKKPKKTVKVTKGEDDEGEVMCSGCGAHVDAEHKFCPECGKSSKKSSATKNHDFSCLGCGKDLDKGEKFCPECGKKNPGYLPEADSKVKKGQRPTPGEGVVGTAAADINPVPAHREPDGPDVERFEMDAHMEEGDEAAEMRAAQRLKSIGTPYQLGALHDLTCPGFHPNHASKCHPTVQLAGMDVSHWAQKAEDAAYGATFADAAKAAEIWQHAVTLKSTEPEVLDELRYEAYKAFRDANPGPSTFPKPTHICAGDFKRPVITAGQAVHGTDYKAPHTFDFSNVRGISADEFNRDYLSTGHAAESPSNKSDVIQPAPMPTGAPQRTYYRNTQRDTARNAMAAMHDHIAHTFPDLCPMGGPGKGGEPPVGVRPVPTPVGAAKSAKKARKTAKIVNQLSKGLRSADEMRAELTKQTGGVDADLIKSAVLEATNGLVEQLAEITKTLGEEQRKTKKLTKAIDALSSLPDPNVAAFRGVVLNPATQKSSAPRDAVLTVAETAERTQATYMRALHEEARDNPDPGQREAAWAKLYEMNGLR